MSIEVTDKAAYMRAYLDLVRRGQHIPGRRGAARAAGIRIVKPPSLRRPPVRRALKDAPAGHCLFCALETQNADQVCNLCRYELEVSR